MRSFTESGLCSVLQYLLLLLAPSFAQEDWHYEGRNIALHRLTSQGPGTYEGYASSSRAVDGNPSTNWFDQSCSGTNLSRQAAFWNVTFDKSYNVSGIMIYNRKTKATRIRLSNFKVFGVDENTDEIELYDDTSYNQYTKTTIPIEVSGQHAYRGIKITTPSRSSNNYHLALCEVQVYAVQCKALPVQNHSTLNPEKPYYQEGAIVTISCDSGYEPHSNYSSVKCQAEGGWNREIPMCKPVSCDLPDPPENGKYITDKNNEGVNRSSIFYLGNIIIGKCDIGYESNNEGKQRECQSDKTWNGGDITCNIKTCQLPGEFSNGAYALDNFNNTLPGELDYGTELVVKCDTGFILSSDSKRRCNEKSTWTGTEPVCNIVTCEHPGNISDGSYFVILGSNKTFMSYTNGTLNYSSEIQVNCTDGFNLTSGNISRECKENGTWNGGKPVCAPIISSSPDTPSSGNSISAALIGGVSAATVFVAATVVVVIYFKRRRGGCGDGLIKRNKMDNKARRFDDIKAKNSQNRGKETVDHVYNNAVCEEDTEYENSVEQTYYNVIRDDDRIPETAINIDNLAEIILRDDAVEKYEQQYKDLPRGMTEKFSVAAKPENIGKNRYRNLYAYDATRVVLDTEDSMESDYINACYIDGFNKRQKYIASQGPTKEILLDFWRMIWQTRSNKIVMLTRLVEGSQIKCEQYWPDEGSSTYGRITLTLENSEKFAHFVQRTLIVEKDKRNKRKIIQFHFTAWPDKGVPKYASSLIQFLHKVNDSPLEEKGPTIVHCSAGIGRTGTYIALDYLMEQANALGYVDVVGTLTALRKQRVSLVQTLDQYILLHHALAEVFMLSTKALPTPEFPQAFNKLLQIDRNKGKTKLAVEFETLKKMLTIIEDLNSKENGTSDEEAISADSVCILRYFYLPSYKDEQPFIVAQTPVRETREQFWRLIWDNDIRTVVMMNNTDETTVQAKYWPDGGKTAEFGNLKIAMENTEDRNGHRLNTFSVQSKDVVRTIKQFQCGGWQRDKTLPDSPHVILSLIELVQTWQQQNRNESVLVHCMNGADKSGVFCVISAVIERLKIEQDVAISYVIHDMRTVRGEIIPSVEQYQFCHEAVLAFIQQYDTYSNFMS